MKEETFLRDLLAKAGISVNGDNPWDIRVHNDKFYPRAISQGSLGFGESYMDGWWDCEAIDKFIYKVIKAGLQEHIRDNKWRLFFHYLKSKLMNLQSSKRSSQVGKQHYDIGNDLFQKMLDKRMVYSCAYWKSAENLDEAQEAKLDLICRKIGLKKEMEVLDIGCGWGSFAKFAAERYDVKVKGITISERQVELGKKKCKDLPVEIELMDYRNVEGIYDAVGT